MRAPKVPLLLTARKSASKPSSQPWLPSITAVLMFAGICWICEWSPQQAGPTSTQMFRDSSAGRAMNVASNYHIAYSTRTFSLQCPTQYLLQLFSRPVQASSAKSLVVLQCGAGVDQLLTRSSESKVDTMPRKSFERVKRR